MTTIKVNVRAIPEDQQGEGFVILKDCLENVKQLINSNAHEEIARREDKGMVLTIISNDDKVYFSAKILDAFVNLSFYHFAIENEKKSLLKKHIIISTPITLFNR